MVKDKYQGENEENTKVYTEDLGGYIFQKPEAYQAQNSGNKLPAVQPVSKEKIVTDLVIHHKIGQKKGLIKLAEKFNLDKKSIETAVSIIEDYNAQTATIHQLMEIGCSAEDVYALYNVREGLWKNPIGIVDISLTKMYELWNNSYGGSVDEDLLFSTITEIRESGPEGEYLSSKVNDVMKLQDGDMSINTERSTDILNGTSPFDVFGTEEGVYIDEPDADELWFNPPK